MYNSKPAIKSLGVTGPTVAIIVIALNAFGIDISGEVADLPNQIARWIDLSIAIAAIVAGIIGRVRANVKIKGVFTAKK